MREILRGFGILKILLIDYEKLTGDKALLACTKPEAFCYTRQWKKWHLILAGAYSGFLQEDIREVMFISKV